MRNSVNIILASICMLLMFSAFRSKDSETPIKKNVGGLNKEILQDQTLFVFGSDDMYKKFETETLSSKPVREKIQNLNIKIVPIAHENSDLMKKYGVTNTPSLVLISNESPPKKRDGLLSAKDFISWIK